jgi:Skp family chaperone for outer membrane proteins
MLGPTAQDFAAAFGLAAADKTIASGNLDGVALAAIKGLNAKLEAKLAARDADLEALSAEVAALRALLSERVANAAR